MGAIVKAIVSVVEIVVGAITQQYWLVAMGAAGLLGTAAGLLLGGQKGSNGVQTQIVYDPTYPRQCIFGRAPSFGSLVWQMAHGDDNKTLEYVVAFADHECDGFDALYVDGELVTLGTPDPVLGYPVTTSVDPVTLLPGTDYTDKLWMKFYSGASGQAVDTRLNTVFPTQWPSTSVGTNICYARFTAKYDTKVMPSIPRFQLVIRGAKLYDPTKDSTAGGSGAHRWGTPSTYEFTENPGVIAYNVCRGFYVGSTLLMGASALASELPYAQWASAINSCNDAISLHAGGTELRYRVGGQVGVDRDAAQFLQAIAVQTGGRIGTGGGTIVYFPGVGQSSVMSFTDDDIMAEEDYEYSQKMPFQALKNAVYGTFVDPNQNWGVASLPIRTSTSDQTEDGGIPLGDAYQLDLTHSYTQGQRVMEIIRRKNRRQITHGPLTLSPKAMKVERGDWVDWTSADFSYSSKLFLVGSVSYKPNCDVVLSLEEIDTSIFSWNPAVDELPPTGGNLASGDPLGGPGAVPNFSAVAQSNGAIVCDWTDLTAANIKGYDLLYNTLPIEAGATMVNEASRQTSETTLAIPPGNWYIGIRARSTSDETGTASWVAVTVPNPNTLIDDLLCAPDFIGTKSGFLLHPWGYLVVDSAGGAANLKLSSGKFLTSARSPVSNPTYQPPTQDTGFNSTLRVFANISTANRGGVAGTSSMTFSLDSWLNGAADPNVFTPWTVGTVTAEYFRFQLAEDPTAADALVTQLEVVIDAPILNQVVQGVAVSHLGTTITYAALTKPDGTHGVGPFHKPPFIGVHPADGVGTGGGASSVQSSPGGGTAVITEYQGGTAIDGTVNLQFIGV